MSFLARKWHIMKNVMISFNNISGLKTSLHYDNVNYVKLCLINLDELMSCLFLWKAMAATLEQQ